MRFAAVSLTYLRISSAPSTIIPCWLAHSLILTPAIISTACSSGSSSSGGAQSGRQFVERIFGQGFLTRLL